MRIYLRVLILLILGLTNASIAFAQSDGLRVHAYGVNEGLSHASVNVVIQDSYGLIWIGTHDGLNKYDGYDFRKYRHNPLDTSSIINNHITCIHEDINGNLWVGTLRGLSLFERKASRFTNYTHNPVDANTISSPAVVAVFQDSEGAVWVKTPSALDRYCQETNTFIRYPHFNEPFAIPELNYIPRIVEKSPKGLWVGSKDGLFYFDKNLGLFKRYHHTKGDISTLADNAIVDILIDLSDNLWVLTHNALNLYNPSTDKFTRFQYRLRGDGSRANHFKSAYLDSKGKIIIGTQNGLLLFNPSTREFIDSPEPSASGRVLGGATILSILEDRTGVLWLGSLSGLYKWDRTPPKFQLYAQRSDGRNLFSNNNVLSVLEDGGKLWVGTSGMGLFVMDRAKQTTTHYHSRAGGDRGLASDFIEFIQKDADGHIIIGTHNGVYSLAKGANRFRDYFQGYNTKAIFKNNRATSIMEDTLGGTWVGTQLGLYHFYSDGVNLFPLKSQGGRHSHQSVTSLALDHEYQLWVGTTAGLYRITPETTSTTTFFGQTPYIQGELVSDQINCLYVDSRGLVWIGTGSGLHYFNLDHNVFYLYTETSGLPNNMVHAIEEDNNGNIWVSTNWGIAKLSFPDNTFSTYTPADGLQGYVFNPRSSYRTQLGELFFGGVAGINSFFPDSILVHSTEPDILITSFEVYGPSGSEIVPVLGISNQEVVLHDFSLITIEFAAMDFTNPSRNQFQYRMIGLDDEWIDIGTRRFATFSHLKEGVYYLRVIGSNSNNVWNNEGATLRIVVKTKPWKTRIARYMYGGLVILSIFVFLRVRTRILRQTNRLLKDREHAMSEVQAQKEELILKNKSITDSITYAKRIQEAIMPNEIHFKRIIPDSFILYMPKDIVSGDFYWVNETKNQIFVAVIDCTGHGVPGAFMSIIGVELLRNIINVQGVNDAAEILNKLNDGVVDVFGNGDENDSMASVKDGMDVSFCIFDKQSATLQYSGAFTTLYIVRDSKIIEVKGDRISVGMASDADIKPSFKSHVIPIMPNDMVYMFTDGYVDQFGGAEGKKYKFRRFRHLLLNIHRYPVDAQRKYLNDSIMDWKGPREQVDDILIIGIKSNV